MKYSLIKRKWLPQGIDLRLIFIGVVILVCLIAPYVHILVDNDSQVEWFGFSNLRVFLYSIGMPISLLCASCIILTATNFISDNKFKTYFISVALLFNYSSVFYLIWIFWSSSDLTETQYYMSIAGISLLFTIAYYIFYKHYHFTITKLQSALNAISRFAFIGVKKHIHPDKMKDYNIDSIKSLDDGML